MVAEMTLGNVPVVVDFDERRVDALFTEFDQCQLPGAAVGIAINRRPVYRKGFGLASMEIPFPLTPSMRMRIGSTTKHFTCLAFMLLCEEARASLDAGIREYLPELHPVVSKATPRQLMGHQSGLRDVQDIAWQFSGTGHVIPTDDLLALYREIDDVNGPPGMAWIYNNGGYIILGAVIERISGLSLEEFFRRRIFEPAGMCDTLLRRNDNDFVPNSATQHMTRLGGGYDRHYLGTLAGDAGMVSTVDDLLRWLSHMANPTVGTPATWEVMRAPQRLSNGVSTGYGLGLRTECYRGVETVSAPGGVLGGNSQVLKVPEVGLDLVVLVNRHDVSAIALGQKILDTCLMGLPPVSEPVRGPRVTGSFQSPITGRVVQLYIRNEQQIASIDGFDLPVVNDGSGSLQAIPSLSHIRQSIVLLSSRERPRSIRLNDFGNLDDMIALGSVEPSDSKRIMGHYRSTTTQSEVEIRLTQTGPRVYVHGRFGKLEYDLECVAEGIWRAMPIDWVQGGILSFDSNYSGFSFFSQRTWALRFQKME